MKFQKYTEIVFYILLIIGLVLVCTKMFREYYNTKNDNNIVEGFMLDGLFGNKLQKPLFGSVVDNDPYHNYPLRDYYIYSSFQSCINNRYIENSKVSLERLSTVLREGFRFIDLDVFSYDGKVVVGTSRINSPVDLGSLNSLDLDDVLKTISNYAFSSGLCPNFNDPLILHMNIKTRITDNYSVIAKAIASNLSLHLLDPDYGYCYDGQNFSKVKLNNLLGKVIICINDEAYKLAPDSLKSLVNITSNGEFMKITDDDSIIYGSNISENIDYNKSKMTIVHHKKVSNDVENPNPVALMSHGCQCVLMTTLSLDKYWEKYYAFFNGSKDEKIPTRKSAFILKPEKLRSIPRVVTPPNPQNPNLTLAPRTSDSGITI